MAEQYPPDLQAAVDQRIAQHADKDSADVLTTLAESTLDNDRLRAQVEALTKELSGIGVQEFQSVRAQLRDAQTKIEALTKERDAFITRADQTAKKLKHVQFLLAHLSANFDMVEKERDAAIARAEAQAKAQQCEDIADDPYAYVKRMENNK